MATPPIILGMSPLVPAALFGWVPAVAVLFVLLPPRRAVLAAFLLAWLFLPVVHEPVLGLRWTKMRATCYGVLLAAAVFDSARLQAFRLRAWDAPLLLWCVCPFASSLSNGLGLYDACSQTLDQTVTWGLPYLIGRLYFADLRGLRDLSVGIIAGGLAYAPLCLIEIRFSPQLHTWVYGYFQHSFAQTIRFGGYRPVVFLDHGLAVGMWMTAASMLALWLWWSRTLPALRPWPGGRPLPMRWVVPALWAVTFLCKSSGALGLGIAGSAVLLLTARTGLRALALAMALAAPWYVWARTWGGWSGLEFAEFLGGSFDRERAASLIFRLENENLLIGRALESPVFGWGGWGRARVYDLDGNDLTVTDGLWVIALGDRGLVGLAGLMGTLLAPAAAVLIRLPGRLWSRPAFAPAAALAVLGAANAIDCLANAMFNPVFVMAAGAVTGAFAAGLPRDPTRRARAGAPAPAPPARSFRRKYPARRGAALSP